MRPRGALHFTFLFACLSVVGSTANAYLYDAAGTKLANAEVNSSKVNWTTLSQSQNQKYAGVGMLVDKTRGAFCTAVVLDVPSKFDEVTVYAITAGHCFEPANKPIGRIQIFERAEFESPTVLRLNAFFDSTKPIDIPVTGVAYATMNGTDIAVLALAVSRRTLSAHGIQGLRLSSTAPAVGEAVRTVGIPMQGVPEAELSLHQVDCRIRHIADFRSNDRTYNILNIHHDCSAIGGMSGSPLIRLSSGEVVGVINSTPVYEEIARYLPDEFLRQYDGENSAAHTIDVSTCFEDGWFNLDLKTCRLQKKFPGRTGREQALNACRAGEGRACFEAARAANNGGIQLTEALAFLKRGCSLGNARSCGSLGIAYEHGLEGRVVRSLDKAVSHYKQACDGGNPGGCRRLALKVRQGHGIERSETEALRLFEKACAWLDEPACTEMARSYLNDQPGRPDSTTLAAQYYAKACVFDGAGCFELGEFYEYGTRVEASVENAATLYRRACVLDYAKGCRKMADLLGAGTVVAKEFENRTHFMMSACGLGDKGSCSANKTSLAEPLHLSFKSPPKPVQCPGEN